MSISVIILNWNGSAMLRKYLPSVVACTPDAEIIVEMCHIQPIPVEGEHILGMIVAHLVAGVPAEANLGQLLIALQHRGQIFLALQILKGNEYSFFFCV